VQHTLVQHIIGYMLLMVISGLLSNLTGQLQNGKIECCKILGGRVPILE